MKLPTIHINGTSRAELLRQNMSALHAVSVARATLEDAAPNGSDYYPQGPDAIVDALKEHGERWGKLLAIEDDLRAICERIQTEGGVR